LAKLIKASKRKLNVLTYSGYYHAELLAMAKINPTVDEFLKATDILIDGPYDQTKRNLNLPFRGSDNQNIIYL